MNNYVTGEIIKELREKNNLTQSALADMINVSPKTISKWENKRGLPDISLLEPLSKALNISLVELFNGKPIINNNKSANILKTKFYVCPICGNVNISIGEGIHYCCGTELICEEFSESNELNISHIENDLYITIPSIMTKDDYISFVVYITTSKIQFVKLYPESKCEAYFEYLGSGLIYYYNNRNGLFREKL